MYLKFACCRKMRSAFARRILNNLLDSPQVKDSENAGLWTKSELNLCYPVIVNVLPVIVHLNRNPVMTSARLCGASVEKLRLEPRLISVPFI